MRADRFTTAAEPQHSQPIQARTPLVLKAAGVLRSAKQGSVARALTEPNAVRTPHPQPENNRKREYRLNNAQRSKFAAQIWATPSLNGGLPGWPAFPPGAGRAGTEFARYLVSAAPLPRQLRLACHRR